MACDLYTYDLVHSTNNFICVGDGIFIPNYVRAFYETVKVFLLPKIGHISPDRTT